MATVEQRAADPANGVYVQVPLKAPAANTTQKVFLQTAYSERADSDDVTIRDTRLVDTAVTAKQMEWQAVAQAMQKASTQFVELQRVTTIEDFKKLLETSPFPDPLQQFRDKIERFVMRVCSHANKSYPVNLAEVTAKFIDDNKALNDSDLYDAFDSQFRALFGTLQIPPSSYSEIFTDELLQLQSEFETARKSCDELKTSQQTFLDHIWQLAVLLSGTSKQKRSRALVLGCLFKIRQALQSPMYNLYKTNEEVVAIRFLHNLCLAALTDAHVVPAFIHLGDQIYEAGDVEQALSLNNSLKKCYDVAVQHGIATDDPANKDSLTSEFKKLGSNFFETSQNISLRDALSSFIKDASSYFNDQFKDHRGRYDNNPGLLYEERLSIDDKKYTACCILSASPAYGTTDKNDCLTIAPEFLAVLQAIENRHFYTIPDDPYPFAGIAYSNLQSKAAEQGRSATKTIMKLPQRFPFSIEAITVSQDRLKEEKLSPQVKENLYKKLTTDSSFKLDGSPGHYFPPKFQASWKESLKQIVDTSYELASKGGKTAEHVIAFNESVAFSIIRTHEMQTVRKFIKTDRPDLNKVIMMRACAVTADRGNKSNSTFLLAHGIDTETIVSVMLGRASCAKQRLPLPERLEEIGILSDVVTQKDLANHLKNVDAVVFSKENFHSHGITLAQALQ